MNDTELKNFIENGRIVLVKNIETNEKFEMYMNNERMD